MIEVGAYSVLEPLRNGGFVTIRALSPEDRPRFVDALHRTSDQTLYSRFFSPKRTFTSEEVEHSLKVDFVEHVALVAVAEEEGRDAIAGSARYIAVNSEAAECAFLVIDQYQGQGIGTLLLRHLAAIARAAGLKQLTAEVLSENASMLEVFERSGLRVERTRDAAVVHVELLLI